MQDTLTIRGSEYPRAIVRTARNYILSGWTPSEIVNLHGRASASSLSDIHNILAQAAHLKVVLGFQCSLSNWSSSALRSLP